MSSFANNSETKTSPHGRERRVALGLLILFSIGLLVVAAPLFIVFAVGMVPSVVAFVCDRDREKYTSIAVCAGNLAGVIPILFSLGMQGPTLARASEILTDIFSIAVMYGAAGGGWLFVAVLPSVVAVYMNVTTETRLQLLRKHQRKLVEEWSNDVARSDKPSVKTG